MHDAGLNCKHSLMARSAFDAWWTFNDSFTAPMMERPWPLGAELLRTSDLRLLSQGNSMEEGLEVALRHVSFLREWALIVVQLGPREIIYFEFRVCYSGPEQRTDWEDQMPI